MSALSAIEDISQADYAAVQKVLCQIEKSRRATLETLANWKLIFRMFRDLELDFERRKDRAGLEETHRALLTSFLALTEVLHTKISELDEEDLRRISLSEESFAGCLKYMRLKYNQWFAPVDPSISRLFETRMSEQ